MAAFKNEFSNSELNFNSSFFDETKKTFSFVFEPQKNCL